MMGAEIYRLMNVPFPKNSRKYKKALWWTVCGWLVPELGLAEETVKKGLGNQVWFVAMILIAFVVGAFALMAYASRGIRNDPKLWEEHKQDLKVAHVRLMQSRTIDDLLTPRDDDKIFRFTVEYEGIPGIHEVKVKPGTEDMNLLISHLVECRQVDDTHITETQILAVNSEQIVNHSSRVSITRALLGGLVAGRAGFILGGLSGCGRSYVQNVANEFTFLVKYDDRESRTEKVMENDRRFQFLIQKLK